MHENIENAIPMPQPIIGQMGQKYDSGPALKNHTATKKAFTIK